jgi:hypothetical protein
MNDTVPEYEAIGICRDRFPGWRQGLRAGFDRKAL